MQGPQGPLPGPSSDFPAQLRTHRSDPQPCGTLGSWFSSPLPIPGPGALLGVPWVTPAPLSVWPCGGNGPASSLGSLLSPCLCMGGSGWGGLLALPHPGSPAPFFGLRSSGCLIRRALVAPSWVRFLAASGCSWEAILGGQGDPGNWGGPDKHPAESLGVSWLYPTGFHFAPLPQFLYVSNEGGVGPTGPRWPALS